MTHRSASIAAGILLALTLATGCTSQPGGTSSTGPPVASQPDPNGTSPCFEPPPEAIKTAADYIKAYPETFGGKKATGPWQATAAGDGMLLATRLPGGQLAVFYLTGGPIYDIVEVNNAFPGYGPAASCL